MMQEQGELRSFITALRSGPEVTLREMVRDLRSLAERMSKQNSITLLAVVLMGGVYNLWGAVVSALFLRLLPALLDNWGVATELLTILFGVGALQVLLTAPGGIVEQLPRCPTSATWRPIGSLVRRALSAPERAP